MTSEMAQGAKTQDLAHVTIGINDSQPQAKAIPAGDTIVSTLKTEFGVDKAFVLYLVHGNSRKTLNNDDTVDVKSGMHFEAIGGGGVS